MTIKSKAVLSIALAVSGLGMATLSAPSHACDSEPFIGSVCAMAISPSRFQGISSTFLLAQGQTLPINQYAALFSLMGVTFGGDGTSNFKLPDLRGKVIVGYDPVNYQFGQTGGNASIRLSVAQLPPHSLPITNLPVSMTGVAATTTTSTLSATANLSGLVITGAASGLTIKASSTANGANSPGGKYLGKSAGAAGNLYTATAPDVTLAPDSVGGNLSLTVGAGVNAPVAIGGYATTSLSGNASANGTTGVIGGGADVPVMPPYLVLPYYIAVNGLYPSSD
jgi:microcystin-dependent protein